jgi:hypothetical protein
MKNPAQGRGFSKRLHDWTGNRIVAVCQYNVSIVPHPKRFNTSPLRGAFSCVLASGRSPESLFAPIVAVLQESNQHKRVENSPTPDCHDQHVNAWERTITSLWAMLGKWGRYAL